MTVKSITFTPEEVELIEQGLNFSEDESVFIIDKEHPVIDRSVLCIERTVELEKAIIDDTISNVAHYRLGNGLRYTNYVEDLFLGELLTVNFHAVTIEIDEGSKSFVESLVTIPFKRTKDNFNYSLHMIIDKLKEEYETAYLIPFLLTTTRFSQYELHIVLVKAEVEAPYVVTSRAYNKDKIRQAIEDLYKA